MASAGSLNERVRFERRSADANGELLGPWAELVTVWAEVKPLNGGEAVVASRLQGRQPFALTVRCTALTRSLSLADRAVNVGTGLVYDPITSVAPDTRRAWVAVLATSKAGLNDG